MPASPAANLSSSAGNWRNTASATGLQRYERELHEFNQFENVLDTSTRVADLFAKYLGIDPNDGTSRPHRPE
ncbi:hypothetical protein [Haladaptatus sp. NG-SE-30]